jgi:hypothetical protein
VIVEAGWHVLTALLAWVIGLLPTATAPAWVAGATTQVQAAVTPILALGMWIPLGAIGTVVVSLLAIWVSAFVIRVSRIGLSAFTGGGGSAA